MSLRLFLVSAVVEGEAPGEVGVLIEEVEVVESSAVDEDMRVHEVQISKEDLDAAKPVSSAGLVGEDHADLLILVLYLLGLVLLDEDQLDEDVAVLRIVNQLEDITLGVLVGLGLLIEDNVVLVIGRLFF